VAQGNAVSAKGGSDVEILLINGKKKLLKIGGWILALILLIGLLPGIFKFFFYHLPVLGNWFEKDRPSGNPMRVEQWLDGTRFNQKVDELVFKIQNFDRQEKNEQDMAK